MLHRLETPPRGTPAGTLVVLHGYGADERDLLSIGPELDPGLRVVSLQAPIALPWGGRAWFNLRQSPTGFAWEPAEVLAAHEQALAAIERVAAEDKRPPLLLGFSQGACMALMTALVRPGTVRGVLSLSGVPPRLPEALRAKPDALKGLPVFAAHGTQDPLLPIALGRANHTELAALGLDVTWREYAMPHAVVQQELADARAWLKTLKVWPPAK